MGGGKERERKGKREREVGREKGNRKRERG